MANPIIFGCIAFFVRSYSLKQTVVHGQKKGAEDAEAGAEGHAEEETTRSVNDSQNPSAAITPQESHVDEKHGIRPEGTEREGA